MNKIITIIIILCYSISPSQAKGIFGGLIGGAVGRSIGESKKTLSQNDKEKILLDMANKINKGLPKRLNEYRRLDSISSGPGLLFTYHYTLTQDTSKSVSENDIKAFLQEDRKAVKLTFCNTPATLFFPKQNITASYSFRLSDGVYAGKFDIYPVDCGY